MNEEIRQQIVDAYAGMVKGARCRPATPNPLDLNYTPEELQDYVENWWKEEEAQDFNIGCPSHEGRKALIWTVEAARLICAVAYEPALQLLKMAAEEVERAQEERRKAGIPDLGGSL